MAERTPDDFRAFRVHVDGESVSRRVERCGREILPSNDVEVAVAYSSLNYKDALSASGNRGVTKEYPHTPGIDMAGTVTASRDERFSPGDRVLCTGFDLGMNTPGGFGEYVSVPGDWLLRLPAGLGARQAMALGTAGLTAALALGRLAAAGATSDLGPLVVTGASGGVGSVAVWLASRVGHEVVASTGTPAAAGMLTALGAARIMDRAELAEPNPRPMLRADLAGAVDTVGGHTLSNLLKRTAVGGAVAACGLVGGADLETTVYPFILRGVSLMGVDSQHASPQSRERAWGDLAAAAAAEPEKLELLTTEVTLDELEPRIEQVLSGRTVGRVLVRVLGE